MARAMKAAYLKKPGASIEVIDVPEPELRSGGIIVSIQAAPVLSFMRKVVSGELGYSMATPWIPGANGVGVVETVADDVVGIQRGQRVFIDPHIHTHTNTDTYDGILIGLTALSPHSAPLQQQWRHGTFAQKALIPAECLTMVPDDLSDPERLSILSFAAIAYGGLVKGGFRSGQTLIVSGATGNIGSCAVLVGLALGAKRVVALGREEGVLERVRALDPKRVKAVRLTGDFEADKQSVAAITGGADLVYDILGNVPSFEPTAAAIYALRRGGAAVLMGGVQAAMNLPYSYIMLNEISIQGAFMYPRSAPRELLNMVAAGTLDLSKPEIRSFPLGGVVAALNHAESVRGPSYTVLVP